MKKWTWDAVGGSGLLLLASGCGAVYLPLFPIVIGVALIIIAILGARPK